MGVSRVVRCLGASLGVLLPIIASASPIRAPGLPQRAVVMRIDSERGACTNGIDDDDDKRMDCADPDCRTDVACLEPAHCADGIDNDLDGLIDCEDTDDCCGSTACLGSPSCPETPCDDGIDNDGDGPIDCADSDCAFGPCIEFLNCADGRDNDRDGLIDCRDTLDCCGTFECLGSPHCPFEICGNGIDDEGDGLIDCDDPDCACDERTPQCTDGIDNDGDTLVDCADPGCAADPACDEFAHCTDGADNDGDGLIDCADLSDCCPDPACDGAPGCPERICDDGIDNDGDGRIDCLDFDCRSRPECRESLHCDDGIDNDVDGRTDCEDLSDCCRAPECSGAPGCPERICDDGIDNDADGWIDCDDSDCAGDPACDCDDGACDDPNGLLFPPTTDCQLLSASTCEGTYFLHVALAAGRRYTFTLCPSRCPGADAEFVARLHLFTPAGYSAATNAGACVDGAEISYLTDPVDGAGLYCVRIDNNGGGRRFTLGWIVDCVVPTRLTVFPSAGATDDPACERPQVFVASVDGTAAYDWTWTITPPPGGSASPATGSGRGDIGAFEFQSMLSGGGVYVVRVQARNACGVVASATAFELIDHAGPSAIAIAAAAPCSLRRLRTMRRSFSPPCPAPCDAGVLTAPGDYFDVFLRCGDGAPTIRTGPFHPATLGAGAPLDVLYNGAVGLPGSSEIAWRVHEAALTLANPDGGVACLFDPPDTPDEPLSLGIAQEWTISPRPSLNLLLREEIVTFGSTIDDAGVRITLEATNVATSSDSTIIGMRWLLDHRHGADDGPLFVSRQCDPPSESAVIATEHDLLPGEISDLYRIENDDGAPVFSIAGSTSQLSGFAGTRRPDRLTFAGWQRARRAPWNYVAAEGNPAPDDDSAVLIWMGATPETGFNLAPGGSVSRTVVLTATPAATGCGRFSDGSSVDALTTICPGECARVGVDGLDGCGPTSVSLVSRSPGAPDCLAPPCTLPFLVAGRYDYDWEVEDVAGFVRGARSTIVVRDPTDPECNQPPTCEPARAVMTTCFVASLEGATVDDPDGDAIAWAWSSSRPDVTIVPSSGVLPSGSGPRTLPAAMATLAGVPACDETAVATLLLDDGNGGFVECATALAFDDDIPPEIPGVPADETVSCDAVPLPPVLLARDACDPAPTLAFAEVRVAGRCPDAYVLRREWIATDSCGNTLVASQQVDVIDDVAPEIPGVPVDETVPCDAVPPAPVLLARDACDPAPTLTFAEDVLPGRCPGEWTIMRRWTAQDRCANTFTQEQIVSVVDMQPPEVMPGTDVLDCVWPPNHRMACFTTDDFAPVVSDSCSGPVTWRFADCGSSQPDNDIGDGNTTRDCAVAADGSGLCVRSERQGPDRRGRFYGVRVIATDACGNESAPVGIGTIWIPHDQRTHPTCRRPRR